MRFDLGFAFTAIKLFTNYHFNSAWLVVDANQTVFFSSAQEPNKKIHRPKRRSSQLSISIKRSPWWMSVCSWNVAQICSWRNRQSLWAFFRSNAYKNGSFFDWRRRRRCLKNWNLSKLTMTDIWVKRHMTVISLTYFAHLLLSSVIEHQQIVNV